MPFRKKKTVAWHRKACPTAYVVVHVVTDNAAQVPVESGVVGNKGRDHELSTECGVTRSMRWREVFELEA